MKRINANGFIPLMLTIITIVLALIYLVFTRVLHSRH